MIADIQYNSWSKQRQVDQLNGMIVTESESDNPDAISRSQSVFDDTLKDIVIKKCKSIQRQVRHRRAKRIVEQTYL